MLVKKKDLYALTPNHFQEYLWLLQQPLTFDNNRFVFNQQSCNFTLVCILQNGQVFQMMVTQVNFAELAPGAE